MCKLALSNQKQSIMKTVYHITVASQAKTQWPKITFYGFRVDAELACSLEWVGPIYLC